VPLVLGAILIVAARRLSDPEDLHALYHYASVVVKVVAAGSCLLAAAQFRPRDYLLRAWGLAGLSMALLAATDLAVGTSTHLGFTQGSPYGPSALLLRAVLLIGASVAGSVGAFLLARAVSASGLGHPGTHGGRVAFVLIALVVALALESNALRYDLPGTFRGNGMAVGNLALDLGDVVTVVLIAPLILTIVRLRGGLWGWPYLLYAMGSVVWLFYDATGVLGEMDLMLRAEIEGGLRVTACLYLAAAAIGQVLSAHRTHVALASS
jgi:hypothetical protein